MPESSDVHTNLKLLSATDIAAWQIPSLSPQTSCSAKLPALQRSAVWKPRQIEMLWDSLLRGFPVGSFLLTPFHGSRKTQKFLHALPESEVNEAEYHLLDGQQRCNAITLGFLNAWAPDESHSAALWVDLDKEGITDERGFVFRVLTKSHPWGYQRSDPSKTLEQHHRRKALHAYTQVFKLSNKDENIETLFGSSRLIKHAWPWDAVSPVPFPLLLEAVKRSPENAWPVLEKLMQEKLPYCSCVGDLQTDKIKNDIDWHGNLSRLFANPTPMMCELVQCIKALLGIDRPKPLQIPALVLQSVVTDAPSDNGLTSGANAFSENHQDPVETLFIRINSAGTPLQGEELNYSILKSIWPGAQDIVENLSTGIMAPSRLVALISRLVVAKSASKDNRPPAALDVARFRRLVHGRDSQCPFFMKLIQDYLRNGTAKKIFAMLQQVLTLQAGEQASFRLPAVLVADIARTSPEVLFIVLVWLDRLLEAEMDPVELDDAHQRRLIGALTALSWFSEDQASCATVLWSRLIKHNDANLVEMFSVAALKECIDVQENGRLPLIPLLPPQLLKESVEKSLYGLGNGTNHTWKTWRWWDHFSGILPKSESAKKWYSRKISEDTDEVEYRREAWTKFVDRLWARKEIVLYAQREWLVKWYPHYDPASPDQLEDTDRPWDYDHIHPQKYIYARWNIPQVIKDWHGSIGNFRAWPFELNRSDAETSPGMKLTTAEKELDHRFFANHSNGALHKEILKASYISKTKDWPHWETCAPSDDSFPGNYLANAEKYGACRVSLINAITKRWISLYREWYDQLLIKDLF